MATNYGTQPIVSNGLLWRVDASNNGKNLNPAGSNSLVGNTSTIGFSGSLQGGMSRVTSEPQYWEFDGADDFIQFAANSTIDGNNPLSLNGSADATFEFWVAPDYTGDTYQRILAKSNAGGGGVGGYALLLLSKEFLFYIDDGGGGTPPIAAQYTTSANAGEWLHIVITRNGTSYVAYENGVVKDTNTATANFVTTAAGLRIGSWNHSTGREYNGKLAVAAIYTITLTADQVLQNYNALKGRFE